MSWTHSITSSSISVQSVLGCLVALLVLRYVWSLLSQPKHKLLPGPRPLPIIGNVLDLPKHGESQTTLWSQHKQLYGPISRLNVLGQTIVVINDPKIAKELLDKRSNNYSNRAQLTFAGDMLGFGSTMLFIQADDRLRFQRKVAHNQLGSLSSLQKWNGDIDIETRRYLYRQLIQPEKWTQNLRHEAGSIILKIVYGYNVEPDARDRLVDLIEEVMVILSQALVPGAWPVDIFPFLRYLPDWTPGLQFKALAKKWSPMVYESVDRPFNFTRRQMEQGSAPVSLTSESIRKLDPTASDEELELIKFAAGSMFAAGSDTSVVLMEMFYLAMVKYPEIQHKAQAELDAVVGKHRLPEMSDRANLPYVEALMKEVFRWESLGEVIPPHRSAEDDFYEGYFIPKNSIILVNARGMTKDKEIYSDPSDFKPERFLGEHPEYDPNDITWGFGRRICPGRWLATSNLWLEISRTLSCFDIKAVKGREPKREFTYGLVVRPLPFEIDIRVRSPEQENLIRSVAAEHPFPERGDGHLL